MSSSPLNYVKINHKSNLFTNIKQNKQVCSKENAVDTAQKLHRRLNSNTIEVMFYKQIRKQQKDQIHGTNANNANNQLQKNSSQKIFRNHQDQLLMQSNQSNYYLKNYESQRQKKIEYMFNKTQQEIQQQQKLYSTSRSPPDAFLTPKKSQNNQDQIIHSQKSDSKFDDSQDKDNIINQLQQTNNNLKNDMEILKKNNYQLQWENIQSKLQIEQLQEIKNASQQEEMKRVIIQQTDFIKQLIENKEQITKKYRTFFQEMIDFKVGVDKKFEHYTALFEEIFKKMQEAENIRKSEKLQQSRTHEEETQKNQNNNIFIQDFNKDTDINRSSQTSRTQEEETQKNQNNHLFIQDSNDAEHTKQFQLDTDLIRSYQSSENTETRKDMENDFDQSFQKFLADKKEIKEKLDQIISNFQKQDQIEFQKNTSAPFQDIPEEENQFSFCNSEA